MSIMKFLVLVLIVMLILYKSTNKFNLGLVNITGYKYSPKDKFYVVEFERDGLTEEGFLVSSEPPAWQESKFVIAGYDISKKMWHIIEIKN